MAAPFVKMAFSFLSSGVKLEQKRHSTIVSDINRHGAAYTIKNQLWAASSFHILTRLLLLLLNEGGGTSRSIKSNNSHADTAGLMSILHETKGLVVTFGFGYGVTLFHEYLLSPKGQYEYMNACVI